MKFAKRFGIAATCLLLAAVLVCGSVMWQQQSLADKLIRLHVVANSDSQADQALKLQVRDRILEELTPLCTAISSRDEMVQLLQQQRSRLQLLAEQTLRQNGCGDCVTVSLQEEEFPTRVYDSFALPAGQYLSVRVCIGEAAGHNWWCVCFPALCTAATEDFSAVAAGGGFTQDEIAWIQQEGTNYQVRFWLLERLQALRDALRDS